MAEESGDLPGIGQQHPQALNALIGNAEMAPARVQWRGIPQVQEQRNETVCTFCAHFDAVRLLPRVIKQGAFVLGALCVVMHPLPG